MKSTKFRGHNNYGFRTETIPKICTMSIQEKINLGQATIVDVRTPGEFSMGHIKGSKNIPLDQISSKVDSIKKMNKTIILCCASGIRSGQAEGILKQAGVDAHNGGGWSSLNSKI